jgi:phenylpropionate dioxygenase-like ring-hydroxylating dioxygenase large terminal subunit
VPHHAWSHDFGRLIGVPETHKYARLEKAKPGPIPFSVDTWGCFVFVNMDRGAKSFR